MGDYHDLYLKTDVLALNILVNCIKCIIINYPLSPEKLKISQNMLSKYCSNIADEYGIKIGVVNQLFPNLGNKSH